VNQPTVRVVHRIALPVDECDAISAGTLSLPGLRFPDGSAVVLEVGHGWWMKESEIHHIHRALSNVSHITITGVHSERAGGRLAFGMYYGLDAIAKKLGDLVAEPILPLPETG
jgi:hypothetical protein